MTIDNSGHALILIFADGFLDTALVHPHDGGEAYMVPFLKKGILYAKTHYNSGNIVDVLLSEEDTRKVEYGTIIDLATLDRIRHVYYITYRWSPDVARKTYHLYALHLCAGRYACKNEIPTDQRRIPQCAKCIL